MEQLYGNIMIAPDSEVKDMFEFNNEGRVHKQQQNNRNARTWIIQTCAVITRNCRSVKSGFTQALDEFECKFRAVRRFDWHFLVQQLASLSEHEMASFCFGAIGRTQGSDEYALGI